MSIDVESFGVHWTPDGLSWLQQGRGGVNALGLREVSPFRVRSRKPCNHLIPLNAFNPARSHLTYFETLIRSNGLVRFMLPLPKEADAENPSGVALIRSQDLKIDLLRLTLLAKMSSPIRPPFAWANISSPASVRAELDSTNVQPMILMGVNSRHTSAVADIARQASTSIRKLLLVCEPDVPLPSVSELDSLHFRAQQPADLAALPWETLGAIVLRAYMRGEWDGLWFTREPIPANETKSVRPTTPAAP